MPDLALLSNVQWFILGLSSLLLVFFLGAICKMRSSSSWLPVEGMVTGSGIERTTDSEGTWTYHPHIEYRYEVAGIAHTGTSGAFSRLSVSDKDLVTDPSEKHPAGSRIEVIYNPRRHSESALLSERPTGPWRYCLLLIPLTGYALLFSGVVK